MKLISWNVNGIRAAINKGFEKFFEEIDADIFCLQETKIQMDINEMGPLEQTSLFEDKKEISKDNINLLPIFKDYYCYWNSAEKKGYSGTAIFTKTKPINVTYGIGIEEHDHEGRVITAEFEKFYMVTIYTPNAKRELERLDYRVIWESAVREYLKKLDKKKPVIMCGDLNVAHKEIDLKNPKTNVGNAGFTNEEREEFTKLLDSGFIDTFRYKYPDKELAYSWWSYMHNAREKNIGWRIDYFVISDRLKDKLEEASIYPEIYGSDHCPVGIEIEL
ncbi:MAG: exodeoxyribonuclease III [Clostridia bacterium]|nr:exodeoxyribonuclease III [Clostridia bacterium]